MKTSSWRLPSSKLKTKQRRLQNRISVAKWRPPRPLEDVLKTSSKRPFGVILEVPKRAQNVLMCGIQNVFRTSLPKSKASSVRNNGRSTTTRPAALWVAAWRAYTHLPFYTSHLPARSIIRKWVCDTGGFAEFIHVSNATLWFKKVHFSCHS